MAILVPVDDSEPAMKAVEHAAKQYGETDIVLLHVISPTTSMYGDGAVYAFDEIMDARKEAGKDLLEEAADLATEHGCDVETETIVGQPSRTIVEYADDSGIDHIVIGSHGRSGASRVLLGSVAENVVRRSPAPVTVVR